MKIERIELLVVRLPMVRSFATSSSQKASQTHLLLKVFAEGLVGWGECASPVDPFYCEETTGTCRHIISEFLAPMLVGREWATVDEAVAPWAKVKRNGFARAGLEMACWDLLGQAQGRSVAQLLGATRSEILSGVSLGIEADRSALFAQIEQYLGEGYRRIKLKIGPGHDLAVLSAVRERFPNLPLMADANSAYTLADLATLQAFDQFNLMMIEQPLAHDDIVDHSALQRQMRTPICLDESIHHVDDARKALALGSGQIINIKVSRVGGLANAKRIHDYCYARGVPVWCGGMHEFGIGRAANVAIAALPGYSLPGDVSGSDKYYHDDIIDPPIQALNGAVAVPNTPGLGVNVHTARLAAQTLETIVIAP